MEFRRDDEPLRIYFDPEADVEWPWGAFACGIPGGDTFYGATADAAYAAWRAAPEPCERPA